MPNISREVVNHNNMNDIYKCHFCPRNIKLHNIDKHFKIFHKFGHSDTEYYCEFCDSQEIFLTRDDLLEHIHSIEHMAEKAIPESKMESLDEGKSKFLHLMTNFESQKDATNFLFWIKCNDTKTFLDNHKNENNEFQNTVQDYFEENEDQTMSDGDFTNLNSLKNEFASIDVIFPQEKNFEDEFDEVSNATILDEEITDSNLVTMNNPGIFQEEFYNKDSNKEISYTETDLKSLLDYAIASDNENEDSDDHIKYQEFVDDNTEKKLENNDKSNNPDAGIQMENITQNEMIYEGHKYYKCEHCKKSFTTAGTLKQHIHTHKGHKDYKCETCGKAFPQAYLKKHIHKNHNVNADFKCEYCEKSFPSVRNLKLHIQIIHKGRKIHGCRACGQSFSQQGPLKNHIRIFHDGYKNYKCNSCGESFSEPGNLKKHISTMHEQHEQHKEYKCDFVTSHLTIHQFGVTTDTKFI